MGEVSGRLSGGFQLRASQDRDLPWERINDTGGPALGQIRDSENPDALGSGRFTCQSAVFAEAFPGPHQQACD